MIDYECPKCNHGHEYHLDPIGDGDEVETECDECGFRMVLTCFVSVDYEAECAEHQFGEDGECVVCGRLKPEDDK